MHTRRRVLWRAVADDIEALRLPNGDPFKLLKWERDVLRGVFAPGVTRSGCSVARGNGKSELASGIAVSGLVGVLAEPHGQVIVTASSFQQARIVFASALTMMRPRIEAEPKRFRIVDNEQRALLVDRETGCELRCIGSDAARAHGLRPSGIMVWDEWAQWAQGGERMSSALLTGLGKRPCRIFAIGTRPPTEHHPFARWLRSADFAAVYAADDDCDPLDWRSFLAANPSWRAFPQLRTQIKSEIELAKRDPAMLAPLRALRLNLGTEDTSAAVLLSAESWRACEDGVSERTGPSCWGIDLGSGNAMSAIASYWPASKRLETVAAFPSEPSLHQRATEDGVAGLYERMHERGELLTLGQRVTDIGSLLTVGLERFGRPAVIACDRWREKELRDALDAIGFPQAAVVVRGQGFLDGSQDLREFKVAALDGRIRTPVSLLMRSAMAEARTVSDASGNEKLSKSTEGGRRMRAKDDAVAASILAVAVGSRTPKPRRRRMRSVVGR